VGGLVIFTDLDGTLLDGRTYSFEKALPALEIVHKLSIPLVFVTSKTREEIEVYRKRLDNVHPFISENGGGIYIPQDYFPFPVAGEQQGEYRVVTLGMPYDAVRRRFEKQRTQLGSAVKGFGDMRVDEVVDLTGLSVDDAKLAMHRDFDEPFIF
jgi:mannosyl-3-phosphoglycerate phosphatase family protein